MTQLPLSSIVTRRQNNSQETATFFKELQLFVGMTSLMNVKDVKDSLNFVEFDEKLFTLFIRKSYLWHFTVWSSIVNRATAVLKLVSQIVKFQRIAGGDDFVDECQRCQSLSSKLGRVWRKIWVKKKIWVKTCQKLVKTCQKFWVKNWSSLTKNSLRCSLRNIFIFYCLDINCSTLQWHVNRATLY